MRRDPRRGVAYHLCDPDNPYERAQCAVCSEWTACLEGICDGCYEDLMDLAADAELEYRRDQEWGSQRPAAGIR